MKQFVAFYMTFVIFILVTTPLFSEDKRGFTQEDRERLIRLEATLQTYMQLTDKRFEDINRRFEDMNKRFEDMNKRFEDMNRRLEEMNKRIDETRMDSNKRYDDLREDMNNRFDQIIVFLSILAGVFTALVIFLIGYLYWDRRSFVRRAREEAVEKIERDYRLREILQALREYAKDDVKLERILKGLNLL